MLETYPDILTIQETLEVLGVSKNTIYGLIRTDTIHAFKLGPKMWRIKKPDLLAYLNSQ